MDWKEILYSNLHQNSCHKMTIFLKFKLDLSLKEKNSSDIATLLPCGSRPRCCHQGGTAVRVFTL